MGRLIITVVSVSLAVGLFTALWVGINKVFDETVDHYSRFSVLIGGIVGFVFFGLLHGNRLLMTLPGIESTREALTWGSERHPVTIVADIVTLMWWAIPGAVIFAVIGYLLSQAKEPNRRLAIGLGAGVVVGLILGFSLKTRYLPGLKVAPMLLWPAALAAIGYAISIARGRGNPLRATAFAAGIGWICGTFGVSTLGIGTRPEALMVFVVAGLLFGASVGLRPYPDRNERTVIDQKSRSWIFMTPALLFIGATLVIPGIITFVLSFRNADGEGFVGGDNYLGIFRAPDVNGVQGWNVDNFNLTDWSWILTSRLTWLGLALIGLAVIFALVRGASTGHRVDFEPQTGLVATFGGVLLAFAVFTVLRGTVINNMWWVFAVTLFSTSTGLAIASWSDGAKGERIAKSVIFMPMAISFVGASIIWRFMYRPQEVSKNQTGFLNAVWVWLGAKTARAAPTKGEAPDYDPERYSNLGVGFFDSEFFNFNAKPLFVVLFAVIAGALAWKMVKAAQHSGPSAGLVWGLLALAFAYITYRTATEGIGGYQLQDDGSATPGVIFFREDGPFNNFWLMVVMLWIETGFAMVILSAAIKAVPTEYIEAAKIDGADDSQVFWRITVPQIAPTIGVVVTTVIVRVTKVYDIVAVMTGGNFDTNVLANEMINQSFQFSDAGTGAALAILLFMLVLPVMYLNIRRMQAEA